MNEQQYRYQLHLSSHETIEFKRVRNPRNLYFPDKPGAGFWTSTLYDQATSRSHWVDYYKKSRFSNARWLHVFEYSGGANIYEIDSETAYNRLLKKHNTKYRGKNLLDWSGIATEYDAVRAVRGGLRIEQMWGWDVESTVWFDPLYLSLVRTKPFEG